MSRPSSVILFERLFLVSTLLGLINTMLLQPRVAANHPELSPGLMLAVTVVGVAIAGGLLLLLWYFAARRGSTIARWLLVALGAWTLYSLINLLVSGSAVSGLLTASVIAANVLQLAAIVMLFRPDARPWFARREPVA